MSGATQNLVPTLARRAVPQRVQLRSSDLMGALVEIEQRFAVANWRVGGVPIWPLARVRWFFAEWTAHYAASPATGRSSSYLARLFAGWAAGRRARRTDAAAEDRLDGRRDVVFLSDGLSFTRLDGRWIERFCDPLIETAARRGLTTALWTPLHTYHQPRFQRSQFIQADIDRANILGAVCARVARSHAHLPEREAVVRWLTDHGFGTSALHTARIVSDGARLRAIASMYRRRLERARPRLAFVVSYYSIEGMAFVLACREAGVPVVDLQHGVQGTMHPAYAAWPRAPGSLHPLLPDHFWVWSSWEAGVIEAWAAGMQHAAVNGGNPFLSVWDERSQWPGVCEARERVYRLRGMAASHVPVVLVTLQYGLDPAEQLDRVAALVGAEGRHFSFWVRLHPAMLNRREEIRRRFASAGACEIDEPTDLPLQPLLGSCDVHLTHSSSVVIDAAQFGVRSVITSEYGAELFAPLREGGWASIETGPCDAISAALARSIGAADRPKPTRPPLDAALSSLLARPAAGHVRP